MKIATCKLVLCQQGARNMAHLYLHVQVYLYQVLLLDSAPMRIMLVRPAEGGAEGRRCIGCTVCCVITAARCAAQSAPGQGIS